MEDRKQITTVCSQKNSAKGHATKAEAGMGNISVLVDVEFVLRKELTFPPSFLSPTYCLYHVFERDPWIEFSVIVSDLGNQLPPV